MASIDKTNEIDALSRLAGKAPVASSDAQNEIDVDNEDLKEINNLLSKVDSGEIIDPGLEQVARSYKAAEAASEGIPHYTVGDESPDFFDDDEEEQDLDKAIAQAEEAMHRLEDPDANSELAQDDLNSDDNESEQEEPVEATEEALQEVPIKDVNEPEQVEPITADKETKQEDSSIDINESDTPELEKGANVADNNVPEVPTASDDPNKQLSPEEIAAMFAAAGGGDSEPEPEPEPAPAAPDPGDDPNKKLSPEEIAAMFAAAGGGDSEPEPEPEQTPSESDSEGASEDAGKGDDDTPSPDDILKSMQPADDDPNRALSPEEIEAMFAAAGGGDDAAGDSSTEEGSGTSDDSVDSANGAEESSEDAGADELSLDDIQEETPAADESGESAEGAASSEESSQGDATEEASASEATQDASNDESDEVSEDLDSLMDSLGSDDMDLLENEGASGDSGEGASDELNIEEPSEVPKDELNIEEPSAEGDELSLEEPVEGGEDLNLDGDGDDLMSLSEGGASGEESEDEESAVSNDELDDIELEKKSSKGKKGGKKPAKEKKGKEDDGEKKGFFAKILAALFKEDDEEDGSGNVENNELASLTDENQAVLNEIEGDKKKKKEKKEKKEKEPKPKKEKKPAKKKEKKPKPPKEPKPKKEKKPKVPEGPPPKPIPPRKFILAFLLVIPIGILCALPAYTVPEKAIHEEAQMAFLNGDYEGAYRDYYSLYRAGKLSEDDQILYWKARYISQMRHYYKQYEVFASIGLNVEALNALVKGVEQYEEILEDNERLKELELEYKPGSTPDSLVETEVNIAYYNIQSALETEYGLSIDDVQELITIEEEVDYTKQLQIICGLRAAPE